MTRQTSLLAGLAVVAVLLAWWMLLMAPRNNEIATLREDTDAAVAQQQVVTGRIRSLEQVRTEAPDIEADLAAARQLLPAQPGLPSSVRQLQDAADQSGVVLASISPTRPAAVVERPDLTGIRVSLSVSGGYYQWVDFIRRVEDPRLVGRGVLVDAIDLTVGEYPTLNGNVQLTMFATTSVSPGAAAAPDAAAPQQAPAAEGGDDADEGAGDDAEPAAEAAGELTGGRS